jgi:DNA-binding NarL/FixJ family response regulator
MVAAIGASRRDGITCVLADAGFRVLTSCGDGEALMTSLARERPDVAIVDLCLPPTGTDEGLRIAEAIRSQWPHVGVLVLTPYAEVALAERLLARGPGGVGFLLEDRVVDVGLFAAAASRVAAGGRAIDPLVVDQLLARSDRRRLLAGLTTDERDRTAAIVEGRRTDGEAAVLAWLGFGNDATVWDGSPPAVGQAPPSTEAANRVE